jgi:hypothetical protein
VDKVFMARRMDVRHFLAPLLDKVRFRNNFSIREARWSR